jgi:hypothetical protein
MSSTTLQARKHVTEDDAAPMEEAKRARVEQNSRTPQMPSLLVAQSEQCDWGDASVLRHAHQRRT